MRIFAFYLFGIMTFAAQISANTSKDGRNCETLSEFFLRRKYLRIDYDGSSLKLGARYNQLSSDRQFSEVLDAMQRRLEPEFIKICYKDSNKKHINKINLLKESSLREELSALNYLLYALPHIQKEIHENRTNIQYVNFQEAQASHFLLSKTLKGELVRIYGIDLETHQEFLEFINKSLSENRLTAQNVFYYGSRVMPRTEVLKRDAGCLICIQDDGVEKSAVRVGGLTNISDLEIFVTFSDSLDTWSLERAKRLAEIIRDRMQILFPAFPIHLNLIQVDPSAPLEDQVHVFNQTRASKSVSHYQIASFPLN